MTSVSAVVDAVEELAGDFAVVSVLAAVVVFVDSSAVVSELAVEAAAVVVVVADRFELPTSETVDDPAAVCAADAVDDAMLVVDLLAADDEAFVAVAFELALTPRAVWPVPAFESPPVPEFAEPDDDDVEP